MKDNSYEVRIVRYEHIHGVRPEDMAALVAAVNPQPGQSILEGCAGYGAVTKELMVKSPESIFTAIDLSEAQIARLRENLPTVPSTYIIQAYMRATGLPAESYDTIVIKMGVHEVPLEDQAKLFREVRRLLKPGGFFIIWELALNQENQAIFQDIIRKKDHMAGFDSMAENRYFQREDEVLELYKQTGFQEIEVTHRIEYTFNADNRREELVSCDEREMAHSHGIDAQSEPALRALLDATAEIRLSNLKAYIKRRVPIDMYSELKFREEDGNLFITVQKAIYSGRK